MANNNIVWGLHIGNSCHRASIWINGRLKIITDENSNRSTPLYVAFTETERLLGHAAKKQIDANPQNTVFNVKKIIGRKFSDEAVQKLANRAPFKIVEQNEKPVISIGQKLYTPEDLISMLLIRMKESFETRLGHKAPNLIMSVPAYFNEAQRRGLKDAACMAKLNVLKVVSEPVCAALAFGLDKKGEMTVLVYNLGGSTFSASIIQVDGSFFETRATCYDIFLGGDDFDNRIMDYIVDVQKHKISKSFGLKTVCEKAKITLSTATQVTIESEIVTREQFEELCSNLFKTTITMIDKMLSDNKINKNKIDEIILVGGSTHIPKVQQLLSEYFSGKELNKTVNPCEALAYGTAIQAAIQAKKIKDSNDTIDQLILVDSAPLSLGIETVGQQMIVMIPRNAFVPYIKSQIFSTYANDQTGITIQVFEGERACTRNNSLIGTFELSGITPAQRGTPQIEIIFELSTKGILTVTAEDKNTKKKNQITIRNESNRFSISDIDKIVGEAKKARKEDKEFRQRFNAKLSSRITHIQHH